MSRVILIAYLWLGLLSYASGEYLTVGHVVLRASSESNLRISSDPIPNPFRTLTSSVYTTVPKATVPKATHARRYPPPAKPPTAPQRRGEQYKMIVNLPPCWYVIHEVNVTDKGTFGIGPEKPATLKFSDVGSMGLRLGYGVLHGNDITLGTKQTEHNTLVMDDTSEWTTWECIAGWAAKPSKEVTLSIPPHPTLTALHTDGDAYVACMTDPPEARPSSLAAPPTSSTTSSDSQSSGSASDPGAGSGSLTGRSSNFVTATQDSVVVPSSISGDSVSMSSDTASSGSITGSVCSSFGACLSISIASPEGFSISVPATDESLDTASFNSGILTSTSSDSAPAPVDTGSLCLSSASQCLSSSASPPAPSPTSMSAGPSATFNSSSFEDTFQNRLWIDVPEAAVSVHPLNPQVGDWNAPGPFEHVFDFHAWVPTYLSEVFEVYTKPKGTETWVSAAKCTVGIAHKPTGGETVTFTVTSVAPFVTPSGQVNGAYMTC